MEYRKTSFLMELCPDVYEFLSGLKPIAAFYALLLAVIIVFSLFFQNGFIKFFIDCMMGWTYLSILFVAVIVITFDKEFKVDSLTYENHAYHKEKRYKLSRLWGIVLCVLAIIALNCSSQYRKNYAFLCQDFYVEETTGIYHIFKNCKYIGMNEDDEYVGEKSVEKKTGKELLDTSFKLCVACRERAEDAESEYAANRYMRR